MTWEVVWSGASRQLLCEGLERDYAHMTGPDWEIVYWPPSALTTPWHGLSDRDLRRLYSDEWAKRQSYHTRRRTGLPRNRHAAPTGLMTLLLAAGQAPHVRSTRQLTAAVLTAGLTAGSVPAQQRVRAELSRLVHLGLMTRLAYDQYQTA